MPGHDPLVPPPGAPVGVWWATSTEILRRSWRTLLFVTGLGIAVPLAAASFIQTLLSVAASPMGIPSFSSTSSTAAPDLGHLFALLSIVYPILFLAYVIGTIGWAGGMYALTVEATGQQVSVGSALSYGARRMFRMAGWYLLAALITAAGICACGVGVLYLGFAVSLFSFVVVYEPGANPISRSFRLTHANFGPALGRVALTVLIFYAYSLVVTLVFAIIDATFAIGTFASIFQGGTVAPGQRIGLAALGVVQTLLTAPAYVIILVGLHTTYAQLRAREIPLNTAALRASLGE
jgi:hypothetical protein